MDCFSLLTPVDFFTTPSYSYDTHSLLHHTEYHINHNFFPLTHLHDMKLNFFWRWLCCLKWCQSAWTVLGGPLRCSLSNNALPRNTPFNTQSFQPVIQWYQQQLLVNTDPRMQKPVQSLQWELISHCNNGTYRTREYIPFRQCHVSWTPPQRSIILYLFRHRC